MQRWLPLLIASLALVSCARGEPAASAGPSAAAAPAASAEASALAFDALDAMDTRKPVPLIPMMAHHQKEEMREHLEAVQAIVAGLAADDFGAVEAASKRIGFSEEEAQECTHMGAGAPGFTDQALAFHHQADKIGEAARAKDKARVLSELSSTLQTCTGCHSTWKQHVVTDAAWTARTGGAPPPMAEHGGGHHGKHAPGH